MSNEEIYKELEFAFKKIKEELKFNASFEELEKVFSLKDDAVENSSISDKYDRQLCKRIVNIYFNSYNHLHSLIMPDSSSILNMTESQAFNEHEQNKINLAMNKIMAFISKNNIMSVTQDFSKEGEFIDEGLRLWNEEIQEMMKFTTIKIQENWEKYSKE